MKDQAPGENKAAPRIVSQVSIRVCMVMGRSGLPERGLCVVKTAFVTALPKVEVGTFNLRRLQSRA